MTTLKSLIASGRFWAYVGSTLGATVSIAANIAHSYVPPDHAPAHWAPQPGAVVGAIVWPVFLFIAVEILARVAWPHGWTWQLLRWAGITPVAFVAALVSYRHLSGLLAYYNEESLVSILGPLAVDGLMVMATGALIATSHTNPTLASSPAKQPTTATTTGDSTTADSIPDNPEPTPDLPAHLLTPARFSIVQHEQTNGRSITVDELAARMNIAPAVAGQLIANIRGDNPAPSRVNGHIPNLTGGAR
jgi:hypothetical protein